MNNLKYVVGSFIIFAILVSLLINIYGGIETSYDIERNDTYNGKDIMQSFDDLNIITSINSTVTGVYKLTSPDNPLDLLGGLILAGIGFVKIAASIITLPVEIVSIILTFYYVPPVVLTGLIVLFIVSMAILLLRHYSRGL